MNLAMNEATIKNMQGKGRRAGQELADEFSWDVHRFLRYAMAMRLLDESLGPDRLERGYHFGDFHQTIAENIDTVVGALRDRQDDESVVLAQKLLEWYPAGRCRWARDRTEELLTTIRQWSPGGRLDRSAPDSGVEPSGPDTGAQPSRPADSTEPTWTFRGEPEPRPRSVLRVAPRV